MLLQGYHKSASTTKTFPILSTAQLSISETNFLVFSKIVFVFIVFTNGIIQGSHDREKSGKRDFCKGISQPRKSREKCVLILNKHKKQLGKNNTLHHVETNAIEADEY